MHICSLQASAAAGRAEEEEEDEEEEKAKTYLRFPFTKHMSLAWEPD